MNSVLYSMAFVLALVVCVQGAVVPMATWVWPNGEADPREFGGITVSMDNTDLWIETVQKPQSMPVGGRFCSRALPAVVHTFLSDLKNLGEIRSINVINNAEPWIAGCHCYTRVMVSMGFSIVNRKRLNIDDPESIKGFCSIPFKNNLIRGIPADMDSVRLPPIPDDAWEFLGLAHRHEKNPGDLGMA